MSTRTVSVSSTVVLPAATVVDLLTRPETLRYVCWPLLTFSADVPATLTTGETAVVRLCAFGVVGLWRHEITVVSADGGGMVTEERGGPLRRWRHRLTVEPVDAGTAFYRDEVRLDAGAATPLAVPVVRAFYRWRHRRWRRLARALR